MRRENPGRGAMPAAGHPWPQAVPPAWRVEPRRAARAKERKLQKRRLDDRSDRRAEVVAIAVTVICQERERQMTRRITSAPEQRRPPVRVRLRRITAEQSEPYPPDGQGKMWWERLKKALGTASSDFVNASLLQLQSAAQLPCSGISEIGMNAALALIEAAAPKDEIQGALAVQMACTHAAAMSVLARLGGGHGTERRVVALASAAARLLRAYSGQVEALRRLRHGSDQYMRVEHIHISEGGQAVIGNVRAQGTQTPDSAATGLAAAMPAD